jgi:hypothetical protein
MAKSPSNSFFSNPKFVFPDDLGQECLRSQPVATAGVAVLCRETRLARGRTAMRIPPRTSVTLSLHSTRLRHATRSYQENGPREGRGGISRPGAVGRDRGRGNCAQALLSERYILGGTNSQNPKLHCGFYTRALT